MEQTPYTRLIASLAPDQNDWNVTIPLDWGQGRTAFGGIVAAVMYEAVKKSFPDLPPLRTAHINFIGPAIGDLKISSSVLRAGKNVTFIECCLSGEKGLASKIIFIFANPLPAETEQDYPKRTDIPAPDSLPQYAEPPHKPSFLGHFERRIIKGPEFLSQTHHPEFLIWLRLRDIEAHNTFSSLLALADAPPPAALAATKTLTALSTTNWAINLLRDNPKTEDGWWLLESSTQHIRHGYSSQRMTIWNRSGERVIDALQHIAVFE
jgi:acyl-CoA thioesterase